MPEVHYPTDDWICSCGYDFFGGTLAYSLELYEAHLPKSMRQPE